LVAFLPKHDRASLKVFVGILFRYDITLVNYFKNDSLKLTRRL